MNRLARLLFCVLLLGGSQWLAAPASAQISHSEGGAVDATAAAVLKKAADRFGQNVGFGVTVTVLDGQQKQTLRQSAQVLYHGGRYRVTVGDQEVISDGKMVWQWNKTANEVAVSTASADDIDLLNPGRLLAGYEKAFRAKYIRTEADGTAVVDLQPRSARHFHKIRLLVDEKSGLLRRMEVHRYDSGRELYEIANFKKANTPNSRFTFDTAKHPEAEIIDMR